MFCWRLSVFAEQLQLHAPEHYSGLQRMLEARRAGDEAEAARLYEQLPDQAIDYSVMEKTDRLLLVPAAFGWRDVGSWAELYESLDQDGDGNVVDGESILIDTHSCLIVAPGKLVAAIGVTDLVVVEADDALLICHRDRAEDVKRVVEELGRTGRIKYL
jgi:mannose-1-phosphate guanylyltransferase